MTANPHNLTSRENHIPINTWHFQILIIASAIEKATSYCYSNFLYLLMIKNIFYTFISSGSFFFCKVSFYFHAIIFYFLLCLLFVNFQEFSVWSRCEASVITSYTEYIFISYNMYFNFHHVPTQQTEKQNSNVTC